MDVLADINTVVGLANNLGGFVTRIAEVFRDHDAESPEFPKVALEVSNQLAQAQLQLAELHTSLIALQRRAETDNAIKQRKGNYALAETSTGSFVYRLKDDAGAGEPPHCVCPACFEKDEIQVLQPQYDGNLLKCSSCGAVYRR